MHRCLYVLDFNSINITCINRSLLRTIFRVYWFIISFKISKISHAKSLLNSGNWGWLLVPYLIRTLYLICPPCRLFFYFILVGFCDTKWNVVLLLNNTTIIIFNKHIINFQELVFICHSGLVTFWIV